MKLLSFDNSGKKLKHIANIVFLIEVTIYIILFVLCLIVSGMAPFSALFGFIILVLGPFLSWLSILPLYALGDIQEKVDQIDNVIKQK